MAAPPFFAAMVQGFVHPHWLVNVPFNERYVMEWLRIALAEAFPLKRAAPRKFFVSERAWALVGWRVRALAVARCFLRGARRAGAPYGDFARARACWRRVVRRR